MTPIFKNAGRHNLQNNWGAACVVVWAIIAIFLLALTFGTARAEELPPMDPAPTETPTSVEPTPEPAPATVISGDATALTDAANAVNTNDTQTAAPDTTVITENDALVENTANAEAQTGENIAEGDAGAVVATGKAIASANSINVINTSIINSEGLIRFFNALFGYDFDIRLLGLNYFLNGDAPQENPCDLGECPEAELTVINDSTADVTNTMIVRAQTGSNTADGGAGAGEIVSGNAYASANAFNLVNTTIVDSNYLLLSLNNFGDMMGDVVLPGVDFFNALRERQISQQATILNNNQADVTSTTDVLADTGGNTAGDSGVFTTGDAYASANTTNIVNTNLVGGNSIFFLFRIFGDWTGRIQGLPDGISWQETNTGISFVSEEAEGGLTPSHFGEILAENNNQATLRNDVSAWALTGNNEASGSTGAVSSGNAYASANVLNVVNTNVLGKNWIFAIFNIFGNFSGNIAFGRPDLWVGAAATLATPAYIDSLLTFRFTVVNMGDADAHNVMLSTKHLAEMFQFEMPEGTSPEGVWWSLGDIPRGQTRDLIFHARVNGFPKGSGVTNLVLEVKSDERDNNPEDNTEEIGVSIPKPLFDKAGALPPGDYKIWPDVVMNSIAGISTTTASSSVPFELHLENSKGEIFQGILKDTIKSPSGKIIFSRSLNLGTILPNESIDLSYDVEFSEDAEPGIYTSTTELTGRIQNEVDLYAADLKPVRATSVVEIVPKGQVILPRAIEECRPIISGNLKYGQRNDSEAVRWLQRFLALHEDASVLMTGEYDEATKAAVIAFQDKYSSDILGPWGVLLPTGNVYYTTRKKINELNCGDGTTFPLADSEMKEISAFYKIKLALRAQTGAGTLSENFGVPANRTLFMMAGVAGASATPRRAFYSQPTIFGVPISEIFNTMFKWVTLPIPQVEATTTDGS